MSKDCESGEWDRAMTSPLQKVTWKAEISGPLMTYSSVQQYKNNTAENVEIEYSFPLPYGKSVISKFKVDINGVVRGAKVLEKRESEERYEDAIESGDTPILLELTDKDFCTVSLGNIKPGESAKIELEYFRLLESTGNRIRLTIPTVIDDRYAADWQEIPQEVHEINTNLFVDYECEGLISIKGKFAKSRVSSPTHQLQFKAVDGGLQIEFNSKLDRDIVLDIEGSMQSGVYLAKDGNGYAALANFIPPKGEKTSAMDLAILADCSGSMYGQRIQALKRCLTKFAASFRRADRISLMAFGTEQKLLYLEKGQSILSQFADFDSAVESLDADLGGTDIEQAVRASTELLPGTKGSSAMLILTDGEFWDDGKTIIELAKKGKRRVFILGIGMAPYHNVLTKIAELTGGAYEAVYSAYDIEAAVQRMGERIRSKTASDIRVKWDTPTQWQSEIPKGVFCSESFCSFAFLDKKPEGAQLKWKVDQKPVTVKAEVVDSDVGYKLCQLTACQRMLAAKTKAEALEIGLRYNIAGPETNFFLLVERNEADKAVEYPELVIVPQMPVADRMVCCSSAAPSAAPRRMASRAMPQDAFNAVDNCVSYSMAEDHYEDSSEVDSSDLYTFEENTKLPKPLDTKLRLKLVKIIADYTHAHKELRKLLEAIEAGSDGTIENLTSEILSAQKKYAKLFNAAKGIVPEEFFPIVNDLPEAEAQELRTQQFLQLACFANQIHKSNSLKFIIAFDIAIESMKIKSDEDLRSRLRIS